MAAFFLFDNLEVHDPVTLEEYKERVASLVAQYQGRYRALGGKTERVEGDWSPVFPVIIEFPTFDQAKKWYDSEEYQELKTLRLGAVRTNGVLIDGME